MKAWLVLAALVVTAATNPEFTDSELGMQQPHDDGFEGPSVTGNGGNVTNDCPSCGSHGRPERKDQKCHCVCFPGFEGAKCEKESICTNDCRGRGTCVLGTCRCNEGFCGEDCSDTGDRCTHFSERCVPRCINGGVCIADDSMRDGHGCVCPDGFQGNQCEQKMCKQPCSHHGKCDFTTGTCACAEGFEGSTCEKQRCAMCNNSVPCGDFCIPINAPCTSPPGCAKPGYMLSEETKITYGNVSNETVFPPYATDDFPEKDDSNCSVKCGNRMVCRNRQCVCREGLRGNDCEVAMCPSECLGNGICRQGVCHCDAGFSGPDCGRRECVNNCSGTNGECKNLTEFESVCQCKEGFTGADCKKTYCMNNCSKHGFCDSKEGVCYCFPGWSNADCSMSVCPNQCSGNGECVQGYCKCLHGFSGESCSVKVRVETPDDEACSDIDCHGNGICKKGVCYCHLPHFGKECGLNLCPDNCGHGSCVAGRGCKCKSGWMGSSCRVRKCPADCHGQGTCHMGLCTCDEGFKGESCEEKYCPNECNKHGQCVNDTCVCNQGYGGVGCEKKLCFGEKDVMKECSQKGVCIKGVCQCSAGWTGDKCDKVRCPGDCAFNGTVGGRCKAGRCECFPGFEGDSCSRRTCPDDCSGHGECLRQKCYCDKGWRNDNCAAKECYNNCSSDGNSTVKGFCRDDGKCVCANRYYGIDCSIVRPQRHRCATECVGKCLDDDACQELYNAVKHQEDHENLDNYRKCYMGCTESCNAACKPEAWEKSQVQK